MSREKYSSWAAINSAIKAGARRHIESRGGTVSDQCEAARFDRFLSRLFADGEDSEWLLKGGMGILARVSSSRATHDIDLAVDGGSSLDDAVAALREIAGRDLGDHLRFVLSREKATGGGGNQPDVAIRRLTFTCYDMGTEKKVGDVPVDVVVGHPLIGRVETVEPANRIHLPKNLVTYPYRLFPVVDQVADKVCATVSTKYPGGKRSSRVKDLVDLVVIARSQRLNLDELRIAIATKQTLSGLPVIESFKVPETWADAYEKLAGSTPAAGGLVEVAEAEAYVAELVEPALGTADGPGAVWVPGAGWTDPARVEDAAAEVELAPDGTVYVHSHIRTGWRVQEDWRAARGSGECLA